MTNRISTLIAVVVVSAVAVVGAMFLMDRGPQAAPQESLADAKAACLARGADTPGVGFHWEQATHRCVRTEYVPEPTVP
jgi:hypothetical protein